jgi:Na+-transporting methylmalonyl-CoA/oxaloacetate decarboxylase gamma subunit
LTVGQRLLLKLPDLGRNKSRASTPDVVDEPEATPKRPSTPKRPQTQKALSSSDAATTDRAATKGHPEAALQSGDEDEIEHVEDVEVVDDRPTKTSAKGSSGSTRPTSSRPTSSRSSSSGSSSSRSGRPTPTSAYDGMPTSQLTGLMRKLDDKERLLAFGAAPLGAVLAVVLTLITLSHNPALHHKGHESAGIILADGGVGIVFASFVFLMAWFRRRSLTAFALLFLGYSLGLIGIGIPFLFLGGYLLFRAWRIQKVLTSRGVSTRPQSQKRTTDRTQRDPKSRRDSQAKPTSARPTASKRYTPPKPPPKRPPVAKPEKATGS